MIKKNVYTWIESNPIFLIIGFGIFIRLCLVFMYKHITIYPDSSGYIYLSERILNLNLNNYQGQRSPGYPLLIALSHGKLPFLIFLQNTIGILTSILTYKILVTLRFGKRICLLITICLAVYLPTVFFEFCILSETLTLFLISLIFYSFLSLLKNCKYRVGNYLNIVFLCSTLVLVKPFYIFLPFILFIILLFSNKKISGKAYRHIIILILPILTILGWCQVNYLNTGYFTPTTFYGFNAAQNCVSFAENTSDQYKQIGNIYAKYRDENRAINRGTAMSIWEAYVELEETTQLSFVDLSQLLYNYSIDTIELNKLEYLKQVSISWLDFWKTSLYWESDNIASLSVTNLLKTICLIERILMQIIKIIFIILIPYNIIFYIKRRTKILPTPQFTISIIVFTASILQAVASYGTNSRFSFPFESLIATCVILNISSYIKQKRQLE